MKKQKFIEILKNNCIIRQNGDAKEYVFGDEDIELCAEELDHRINTLNH